jgi:hypothetical protein
MRSDDVIAKLKADALEIARKTPIPKNPKAFLLADKILALSDDYLSGAKTPSPLARTLAREIIARADRINSARK